MKVCGIIAEYDPFHKGHRYHLEAAREKSQADYVICVLGCAFSQRGEPMLFDSHKRAQMALANGADLVLGMPVSFSCAQANRFARGGVSILHQLGLVTTLAFGSESAQTDLLVKAARLLNHPDEGFLFELKSNLKKGLSFAKAQGEALKKSLPDILPSLFSSPNFILGMSYLRELDSLQSPIQPLPIKRTTDYHSPSPGPLASASAVRLKLSKYPACDLREECPEETVELIVSAPRHPKEALDKSLLLSILEQGPKSLLAYSEFTEGLEQRVYLAAKKAASRAELLDLVKTKRYPYARINRALTQALIKMKQYGQQPEYARLLGMKRSAAPLLKAIDQSGFPLISRPAKSRHPEVQQDLRAEEIWQVGAGLGAQTAWKKQVVIIE